MQKGVFGVVVLAAVSTVPYCIFAAVGIRSGLARGVIWTVREGRGRRCYKKEMDAVHVQNRLAFQFSDIDFANDYRTLRPDTIHTRQRVVNVDG